MNKVLYPGSFDPITKGHMNIISQASLIFDEVIVTVMQNSLKANGFFTLEERFNIIKELYKDINKVRVIIGSGATVDVALENDCTSIIRGIRGARDVEFEMGLAQINRDISDNKINTVCLFPDASLVNVSSTAVREVFSLGKDISMYVDDLVKEKMLVKRR